MVLGNMMKLLVMEGVTNHLVASNELAKLDRDNLLECGRNATIFRIPEMDERVRTVCSLKFLDWAVKRLQNGRVFTAE